MVKKGLGKGLGALIQVEEKLKEPAGKAGVIEIDINKIEPNRQQPRKNFDEGPLLELAESLKEYGVIQPLVVKDEGEYFSIVVGERRWRAARLAKIPTLPVIIKNYNDEDMLQVALIENLQRQDLNPIEEAMCYRRLMDEYFYKQEDIAARIGKSRNSVSYSLGLLHLDDDVQLMLSEGKITAGHGRALLGVKDPALQVELALHIMEAGLSVREAEKLAKKSLEPKEAPNKPPATRSHSFGHVELDLKSILGTKVTIRDGKNKGKIEIEYYSDDELDRLLTLFKKLS